MAAQEVQRRAQRVAEPCPGRCAGGPLAVPGTAGLV